MKRLPKMDTIIEEIYVTVKEPESPQSHWKYWYTSDNCWGQFNDIEYEIEYIYVDEPKTLPPPIR
jgi:hypothetical protein